MLSALLAVVSAASLQGYTIGGAVAGMAAGQRLTLADNGSDELTVTGNGTFVFPTPLASNAAYAVTVKAQPYLEQCTVANGTGTVLAEDIISIAISCVPSRLSQIQSLEILIGTRGSGIPATAVANSPAQLLITGGFGTTSGDQFNRNNIDPAHKKVVLGYVDVSEAQLFTTPELFVNGTAPSWFGYEQTQWQLWQVQFWNPAWEPIIFKEIDNVIAQGYDGIYLDAPYGDGDWSPNNVFGNPVYPDATPAMAKLMSDIVRYVKGKNLSNFYLIASDPRGIAEADPSSLNGLDGIYFDGLYWGQDVYQAWWAHLYASEASIYNATGLAIFGADYPPKGNLAADLQASDYYTAHGWVPSVNPGGSVENADVLSTGPFMLTAVPANPVVTGSPRFVNFLSGGLVSAATLIGGDQGDYFTGGPGTNTIKGGAGNDIIYAHPVNAALKGVLDIQLAGSNRNSVTPTLTVLINGKVALSEAPVTANQDNWETQDFRIDVSNYWAIASVVIKAVNASYTSSSVNNGLCVQGISLNGADIPAGKAVRSGSTLVQLNGTVVYLSSPGASLSFSGAALQVVSPLLSDTSDTIDGGGGTNTVVYRGPYSNYSVVKQSDGSILVISRSTAEGPDRLTNIQALQFSDQTIQSASIPQVSSPVIAAVVNGADFKSEPLSPGAWAGIFGQNLGRAEPAATAATTTLGGASVSVCGIPAVLAYNSGPVSTNGSTGWQINALVPDGAAGQTPCPVVATVDGLASQPVSAMIASGIMEVFQFVSSAGTLPIVTHADYSLVGPVSAGLVAAKPGEIVIAWGTGDCATPGITLGGAPAVVAFSGRVGPGLCQINFSVPNTASGNTGLTFSTSPNVYRLWVSP